MLFLEFTEFVLPMGKRRNTKVPVTQEVFNQAVELREHGWKFEYEVLRSGEVFMDVCDGDGELNNALCADDKDSTAIAAQRLVIGAHEHWVELGRPKADTGAFETDPLADDLL